MIALSAPALALLAQAAPAAPPEPATLSAPADWSHVPSLPWRVPPRITPGMVDAIEHEMVAGRCPRAPGEVTVEMIVLVRGDGAVRAVVPRAISCSSIEQFAAGLVTRFARNNLRQPVAGWYRTAITFDRP